MKTKMTICSKELLVLGIFLMTIISLSRWTKNSKPRKFIQPEKRSKCFRCKNSKKNNKKKKEI